MLSLSSEYLLLMPVLSELQNRLRLNPSLFLTASLMGDLKITYADTNTAAGTRQGWVRTTLTNVDRKQIWCVRWLGSPAQVQSLQLVSPGPGSGYSCHYWLWLQSQISLLKPVPPSSISIRGGHWSVPPSTAQGWAFHNLPFTSHSQKRGEQDHSSRWEEWRRRGSAAYIFLGVRASSRNTLMTVWSTRYAECCCCCADHTVTASSPASSGRGIWFSREAQLRKASNRIWLAD